MPQPRLMTAGRLHALTQTLKENTPLTRRQRQELANAVEVLVDRAKRAELAAVTDHLTRAPNPRAFWRDLRDAVRRFRKGRSGPFALVAIDLIGFKKINDTYGESAGDAALRHFVEAAAGLLRRPPCGRRLTARPGLCGCGRHERRSYDRLYRRGGDEFSLIVPDVQTHRDAQTIAVRFCRKFEFEFEGRTLRFAARAVARSARLGELDRLERVVERRLSRAKARERAGNRQRRAGVVLSSSRQRYSHH